MVRFVQWKDLGVDDKTRAAVLGYRESTWNNPGTGIESNYTSYGDLTPVEAVAATGLGFTEFFWDCLIQHYKNHPWNKLPELGEWSSYL